MSRRSALLKSKTAQVFSIVKPAMLFRWSFDEFNFAGSQ